MRLKFENTSLCGSFGQWPLLRVENLTCFIVPYFQVSRKIFLSLEVSCPISFCGKVPFGQYLECQDCHAEEHFL